MKFLGVQLDSTLSWKPYILKLSKKLPRTVGLFYKLRHYAPLETLKQLYYGIFLPFISYGVQVQIVSFVDKCINHPQYFENFFTGLSSKHSIGTRQSRRGNLFLERQNTVQCGIKSIHYAGAKLWNSELKVYLIKSYV